MKFTTGSIEWMLARVSFVPESGCWLWTSVWNQRGYGKFSSGGEYVMAHRRMWELSVGKIPDGMLLCHKCDTPACVNPGHLFVGTQKENIRDAIKKGRFTQYAKPETMAKITRTQVEEIRADTRSACVVSKIYGLSKQQIRRIRSGESWSCVSTVAGHCTPLAESDSPSACPAATFLDLCDDREPDLPCGYTAPTHYLEF